MDATATDKTDRNLYHDSTYELVSITAYLIGVPERIFLNDHEPPKMTVYERLDSNKNARIMRHLCILRTAIEQNYKFINELMKFEFKSILNMPEYVPVSYTHLDVYKRQAVRRVLLDAAVFAALRFAIRCV